jgi:hypothetical protein
MQCSTIKSLFLSFGIGFFFKYIKYFAFIAKKMEKIHIFHEFSTKILKLPNGPRFN